MASYPVEKVMYGRSLSNSVPPGTLKIKRVGLNK